MITVLCRVSRRYFSVFYIARTGKLVQLPLAGFGISPFSFAAFGEDFKFGFDAVEFREAAGESSSFYEEVRGIRDAGALNGTAAYLFYGLKGRFEEIARIEQVPGLSGLKLKDFLRLRFVFEEDIEEEVGLIIEDVFRSQELGDLSTSRYCDLSMQWASQSSLLKGSKLAVFLRSHGDDTFMTMSPVDGSAQCIESYRPWVLEQTIVDPEVKLLAHAIFDSIRNRNTWIYPDQREVELPRLFEVAQRHLSSSEPVFRGAFELVSARGQRLPYTVSRLELSARIGDDPASPKILAQIEGEIRDLQVAAKDVCVFCLDRGVQNDSLQSKLVASGLRVIAVKQEDVESLLNRAVDVAPSRRPILRKLPEPVELPLLDRGFVPGVAVDPLPAVPPDLPVVSKTQKPDLISPAPTEIALPPPLPQVIPRPPRPPAPAIPPTPRNPEVSTGSQPRPSPPPLPPVPQRPEKPAVPVAPNLPSRPSVPAPTQDRSRGPVSTPMPEIPERAVPHAAPTCRPSNAAPPPLPPVAPRGARLSTSEGSHAAALGPEGSRPSDSQKGVGPTKERGSAPPKTKKSRSK